MLTMIKIATTDPRVDVFHVMHGDTPVGIVTIFRVAKDGSLEWHVCRIPDGGILAYFNRFTEQEVRESVAAMDVASFYGTDGFDVQNCFIRVNTAHGRRYYLNRDDDGERVLSFDQRVIYSESDAKEILGDDDFLKSLDSSFLWYWGDTAVEVSAVYEYSSEVLDRVTLVPDAGIRLQSNFKY